MDVLNDDSNSMVGNGILNVLVPTFTQWLTLNESYKN